MRAALLFLTLLSCRTVNEVAPAGPRSAPPAHDWKTDGDLRQEEADARCAAEVPSCKRAFGMYTLPPSPCEHRGTACTEVRSKFDGRWVCACDLCLSDADCSPGEHCRRGGPLCDWRRYPMHCERGERPPEPPCQEPRAIP